MIVVVIKKWKEEWKKVDFVIIINKALYHNAIEASWFGVLYIVRLLLHNACSMQEQQWMQQLQCTYKYNDDNFW